MTVTVTVTARAKDEAKKRVDLDCQVVNQNGELVLNGLARVVAPTRKVRLPRLSAPRIRLFDPEARFRALLEMGDGLAAVRCGVVHPCDPDSLRVVWSNRRTGG